MNEWIYVWMHVNVCVYVCVYEHVCMYEILCVCMLICMFAWMSICMHVCIYVCMCVWIYMCMYLGMYCNQAVITTWHRMHKHLTCLPEVKCRWKCTKATANVLMGCTQDQFEAYSKGCYRWVSTRIHTYIHIYGMVWFMARRPGGCQRASPYPQLGAWL